jgi:excisionase family DNA binding protein
MRKRRDVQLIDLDYRLTVTIDRTAHLLDVGRSTVYELLRAGKLKGLKFGRAHRVVCSDARRRPTVCEARPVRSLWRGRTPMKVRQIEARNDSARAQLAQVPNHFRLAQELRTPGQGAEECHEN